MAATKIKIGFVKDFEVPGTGLTLPNCFWALADTVREFNPDEVTSLTSTKHIKQVLVAYKDLTSFVSTDTSINKPLNVNGGRVVCRVPYEIKELNEVGMQDKLIERIQSNYSYFTDATVIEVDLPGEEV